VVEKVLTFTEINQDDLLFVNEIRNVYADKYLHDSRKFTLEDTEQWFYKSKPNFWIIWDGSVRIGYFRLSNHSIINSNIYIGADIHPNYTNCGYGYNAYIQFIPLIFKKYNLHKISLEVLSNNSRAIHLYNKLGFVKEGIKRDEVKKENLYIDSIIMSIKYDEWFK